MSNKIKSFGDLIMEAIVKVGLSFVAMICLGIFSDFIEEIGIIQYTIVMILHGIIFYLFWLSSKDKKVDLAVIALYIAIFWNVILVGTAIYVMADNADIAYALGNSREFSRFFGEFFAGIAFLTYQYISSIIKFKKIKYYDM